MARKSGSCSDCLFISGSYRVLDTETSMNSRVGTCRKGFVRGLIVENKEQVVFVELNARKVEFPTRFEDMQEWFMHTGAAAKG